MQVLKLSPTSLTSVAISSSGFACALTARGGIFVFKNASTDPSVMQWEKHAQIPLWNVLSWRTAAHTGCARPLTKDAAQLLRWRPYAVTFWDNRLGVVLAATDNQLPHEVISVNLDVALQLPPDKPFIVDESDFDVCAFPSPPSVRIDVVLGEKGMISALPKQLVAGGLSPRKLQSGLRCYFVGSECLCR